MKFQENLLNSSQVVTREQTGKWS